MRWFFKLRITQQLFLLSAIPVIIASISIGVLFSLKTSSLIRKELISRGAVVAENLARDSRVGLETRNQFESIEVHIQGASRQKDVSYVHVTDLKGKILDSSSVAKEYSSFTERRADRKDLGGGAFQFISFSGEPIIEIERRVLSDTKPMRIESEPAGNAHRLGTVIVGLSMASYHERMRQLNSYTALIVAVLLALGLFIGAVFARWVSGRIQNAAQGVRQIASGSYSIRLEAKGDDEIAELSAGFNEMASELERLIAELKDSNISLEKRVQERTTELVEAVKKARQTQNELIQSEKFTVVGQLTASLAHDLNNPLTGILITTQLAMEDEKMKPALQNDLRTIEESANRCKTVIHRLLNFTKGEPFSLSPVSIHEILKEALPAFSHEAQINHVRILNKINAKIPYVWAGAFELKQALGNLIVNAIQSMPEGGDLTLDYQTLSAEEVAISIKDTGKGIETSQLKDLFNGTRKDEKGVKSGMGLLAARRILEQFHGKLEAVSEGAGKGTVFTMTLPIYKER